MTHAARLPVVAAIPNYNMASELRRLLPQLLKQQYAAIFVLDDASADNSREVVARFSSVQFVAGKHNLGAGGNRNRILEVLDFEALIHFIDADTRLETDDVCKVIQACAPKADFAFVVGLTKNADGRQNVWNYGPRPSLYNELGAGRQYKFGELLKTSTAAALSFRKKHSRSLTKWPNPCVPPTAQAVFWGIEQNIVFRSDIFRSYGGFDSSIRETEIIELALRMAKQGLHGYFDPHFCITHTEAQVRTYNRSRRKRVETIKTAFRYGIGTWLITK